MSAAVDLTGAADLDRFFFARCPEIIFHFAALPGGIGASRNNPGHCFHDGAIMGIQLIEACRQQYGMNAGFQLPVNFGSGREISIRELATQIGALTGFRGRIVWTATKPSGRPRRCLDLTRAEREFDFRAVTPFDEGLRRTVEWYLDSRPVPVPVQ